MVPLGDVRSIKKKCFGYHEKLGIPTSDSAKPPVSRLSIDRTRTRFESTNLVGRPNNGRR